MSTLAIPPNRLNLYPSPPSSISSSHSNLSFLSTSPSLSSSSTFSDISISSIPSIIRSPTPPPSSSKTHAFFASPFPTRPPTPPTPPHRPTKLTPSPTSKPTPIPTPIQIQVIDTSNQSTPRPPSLEPSWTRPSSTSDPIPGFVISDPEPSPLSPTGPTTSPPPSTTLRLIRPLGHGAFSSVWLADDLSPVPLLLKSRRSLRDLRSKSPSTASSTEGAGTATAPGTTQPARASSLRKLRARLRGTSPVHPELLQRTLSRASSIRRRSTVAIEDPPSSPPPSDSTLSRRGSTKGRLVAIKMTRRGGPGSTEEAERTRVAFVREVEVLRHISHPNITPLLTHLTTPTHHLLVLPFLPGGDLLALVNSDVAWTKFGESVLRRIGGELCRAVGWMHGVGLVHRDIKLENILLTTTAYTSLTPTSPPPTLSDLPTPLIKLTDFGLSRFVDIRTEAQRRADRQARRARRASGSSIKSSSSSVFMGSASPSASGSDLEDESHPPSSPSPFHNDNDIQNDDDEEEEDEEDSGPLLSTRCGSEAYAAPELVMGSTGGRRGVYDARETDAWACGVVIYALVGRRLPFGEGVSGAGAGAGGAAGRAERRHWLMRIARGEYEWPEHPFEGGEEREGEGEGEGELMGRRLAESVGARRVVGRLLVRDPRKRARVGDVFSDPWFSGQDHSEPPEQQEQQEQENGPSLEGADLEMDVEGEQEQEELEMEMEMALEEEEAAFEDGWLVEEETIGEIARREVV